MFFHNFKYGILMSLRNKTQIFWSLLFTIILGTLFQSTFGNAYELELAHSIKVACYIEDETIETAFNTTAANATLNDEGELLMDITKADSMEEAEKLLSDEDVTGVFYSEDGSLKLKIKENGIYQSVLTNVVEQFHQNQSILTDVMEKDDQAVIQAVIMLMSADGSNNVNRKITDNDMNPYLIYFYNLIAMSCLFASFSVIDVTSRNQGNLSAVGARKCVAKRNIVIGGIAELAAYVFVMTVLSFLSFLYLILIGVDFGDKIAAILLTIFVGVIMGTAFGFFVGSFNISEGAKNGIVVGISLACCFFSGLMVANLRSIIEESCPIFNDINPAAMICDSLYALDIYDGYGRLAINLASMLIVSVIFIAGGLIVGRRKSYASL